MSEPRIGGQHGLIRPHRVRLTVGDLAPARHDDEAPRDAQDGLHVVIDDDERPAALVELANPVEELVMQPRMHASERLVQEQHSGPERARRHIHERRLAGAIRADQPEEVTLGDDEVHGVVGDDAPEPLDEAHAPHELGAPAHVPDSLSGTVGAADSGLTRASPSRRNCSQKGVTMPLRAKRMVSRRTMPKTGSRHWPYSRSHSSRNSTTKAPPTAVGRRSMPPITVMTSSLAISSRSPTLGVMMPM